jgi:hypothetical protein
LVTICSSPSGAYNAGNYGYPSFAKQWKEGTRISFGAYDFRRKLVANANRAGGQFTFEQVIVTAGNHEFLRELGYNFN